MSHPVFKLPPLVRNDLRLPKVTGIDIPFAPFQIQSLIGIECWPHDFVPAELWGHRWNAPWTGFCTPFEVGFLADHRPKTLSPRKEDCYSSTRYKTLACMGNWI